MSKPLKILLVEDSERDAALLVLYLRRGGYEPVIQRVEREADMKKKLASDHFDVIVSDFNLPGFSGFEAIRTLNESGKKIPLIVLSGEINEKIISGVKEAGAKHYLAKYEMRQIVPTIERALKEGA
jgi:phosphoserine phosphatase RsbU/P